jgi:type III secretion protein D
MTKRLRVLTGKHAGAGQELAVGSHRVGHHTDCGLYISDWNFESPAVCIEVGPDAAAARATWFDAGTDPGRIAGQQELRDLRPVRFGDVVLCLGPVDAAWPSDVALLRSLLGPGGLIVDAVRRRALPLIGFGSAAVMTVLGCFAYAVPHQEAPLVQTNDQLGAAVRMQAAALQLSALQVVVDPSGVAVRGLVDEAAALQGLRAALDRIDPQRRISHQYATAVEVADSIRNALGAPHLTVKHQGGGVFVLEGQARQLDALQAAAARVAADMRGTVQRIDVAATALPSSGAQMPLLSALSDASDSYVQTKDGVKHLTVMPPAESAMSRPPSPQTLTPTQELIR